MEKANFGEILVHFQHFILTPGAGAGTGHPCWAGLGVDSGDSVDGTAPRHGSATSAGTRSSQGAANFGCCSHLPLEMQLDLSDLNGKQCSLKGLPAVMQ